MTTWVFTVKYPDTPWFDFACEAPDDKTAMRIAHEWHPNARITPNYNFTAESANSPPRPQDD